MTKAERKDHDDDTTVQAVSPDQAALAATPVEQGGAPPVAAGAADSTAPEVMQLAPMFWMLSPKGNFFPAYDHGARQELEGVGCEVSDQTPEGMPAATGASGTGLHA